MFKHQEKGYSLIFVLMLIVLLGVFITAAMNVIKVNTEHFSRTINNESSIYYAEAGINRYISFLNQQAEFWRTDRSDEITNTLISFENGFYELDVIEIPDTIEDSIVIVSTGWVDGGVERVIRVELAHDGDAQFTDFVYGTNEEELPSGEEIWWATGDVVDGRIFTNGTLNIQGAPIFNGEVLYGEGINEQYGSNPQYNAGSPRQESREFPATNDNLKELAKEDEGLYYSGRTCILIEGDRLKIRNGDSGVFYEDIPENGVLYVDSIDGATGKFDLKAGNLFISGELNGQLTVSAENNIYITGYDPTNWDDPETFSESDITGGLTYASDPAENPDSDDMLGIVAENDVEILHYGWPRESGSWPEYEISWFTRRRVNDVAIDDIEINAAIMALYGSFGFEAYDEGSSKGTINLNGSVVQNRRGPVGIVGGSHGYYKNYSYDERMMTTPPPNFIKPANYGWRINRWDMLR